MADHSKTVPVFHAARIARDGALPEPIHFVLPQMGMPRTISNRLPGQVYLEDYFPTGMEHHTVLGEFLDSWGHAETAISRLFCRMAKIEFRNGMIICRSMTQRSVHEALFALGTAQLTDTGIEHLVDLLDAIKSANAKRNVIIHGQWTIEVATWGRRGKTKFKVRLLRETMPQDFRKRVELVDLRNQKDRLRHCFDLRRISVAGREAMKIGADVRTFLSRLEFYRRKPSDGWQLTPLNGWRLSEFFQQLDQSTHPVR